MKGMVHVYTGNGKGKTTAAFGLALRGIGAGKRMHIIQFIKSMEYSEINAFKKYFPFVPIEQFGRGCFIVNKPEKEDILEAKRGFKRVKELLKRKDIDILILDEINIAIYYGMVDCAELIEQLKNRNQEMEVVITGRYAKKELIDFADLVTEMKEVKHYYNSGVEAKDGIER